MIRKLWAITLPPLFPSITLLLYPPFLLNKFIGPTTTLPRGTRRLFAEQTEQKKTNNKALTGYPRVNRLMYLRKRA